MNSHYARSLVGISETATLDQIRRAFRRQALQCHPDKAARTLTSVKDDKDGLVIVSTEKFQELLEAFQFLQREFAEDTDAQLIASCREELQSGSGNTVPLSQLFQLDHRLYALTCRCGTDIPLELDFFSQFEDDVAIDCDGCSLVYRVLLHT